MAKSAVVDWPPAISDSQLEALTLLATTYALSHGLVYLPVEKVQLPAPTSVIHAPIALFPSPIPRHLFHLAQTLQRTYNVLYARVATDEKFLDRVMGEVEGVGKVDEFTGQLWRRWRKLRDEGTVQPLQLGLFRSDYLLHTPPGADPSLKQTAGLHILQKSPHLKEENFPPNYTIAGLAEGLAEAHKVYNCRFYSCCTGRRSNVHSIHVIRQSFNQLLHSAKVDPETRALRVTPPNSFLSDGSESVEISTVYLRAGYTPIDYPTSAHYDLRYLFESSRAIQCPSIQLQLAGGKKVQEVLTKPGVLESFLMNEAQVDRLRASWMGMWGLDEEIDSDGTTHEGLGVLRARELSASLVLKPQREGGGNNVYKEAIQPFLDSLPPQEREAWIAMRLIAVPEGLGNYLVRAGGGTDGAVKTEVVSELGIFGWALFGGADGGVKEKEVGCNEGGVAAGFSVLDSVVLVD
ncbi:hypothetical protein BKA93DRAFT_800833 [Sparassis latifolia]